MWTFGGKKTSLFGRVSVWQFVLLGCSFWFMVVSFGNSSLGCRVARTLAWWSIVMQMSYDWIVSHLCVFDMTSNLSEMLHVSPHNPFWWFLLQNYSGSQSTSFPTFHFAHLCPGKYTCYTLLLVSCIAAIKPPPSTSLSTWTAIPMHGGCEVAPGQDHLTQACFASLNAEQRHTFLTFEKVWTN